jgi:molybdate transport system ATP-binding protein
VDFEGRCAAHGRRMSLEVLVSKRLGEFALQAELKTDARRICLFGHSGAGKTTLANVVAGLVRPDEGRVAIGGETLFDSGRGIAAPSWRRRIGYVFQEPRLFPHMSVEANLLYARRVGGVGAEGASLGETAKLLGLEALLHRRPGALSGGEARRVSIGRALLSDPRLIIMDEPLTGLDGARRAELLAHLDALGRRGGPPILYVSHSVEETARLAEVVVLMKSGRTLICAPPGEAFDHPEAEAAAGLTAPISVLEGEVTGHTVDSTRVALGSAMFLTPRLNLEMGALARIVVDARDVAIALSDPVDTSVQNRLKARITNIEPHAGGLLLRLDAHGTRLKSLVTRQAAERLSLAPGAEVYALIKAVASARQG